MLVKEFKEERLAAVETSRTPSNAISLNEELMELKKRIKEQENEIRRLKEENGIP